MYENEGDKIIMQIKKNILIKKIMMSYIIDDYSLINSVFQWISWTFILITPMLSFIAQLFTESASYINTIILVFSTISATIIKLRNAMNTDQITLDAKSQSIKYESLYQKIIGEYIKPENKRQTQEDFIYWITREYNSIEVNDPEMSHKSRIKFIRDCSEKGIQYDEDITLLLNLIRTESLENLHTPRSAKEDNYDIADHKNKIKNFNTKDDVKWTMDRLNIA